MAAPKVRGDYAQLQHIATQFKAESDRAGSMLRAIKGDVERLRGGDWLGQGARKFYGEMDAHVLPAINRLAHALGEANRVTLQIRQMIQQAEADAARILDKEPGEGGMPAALGPGGLLLGNGPEPTGTPTPGGNPSNQPVAVPKPTPPSPQSPTQTPTPAASSVPPRVYVINGVANDGRGNLELRDYLIKHGFSNNQDQVIAVTGIYDTNLGGKYGKVGKVIDFLIGSGQTIREYIAGGSVFTDRAEDQIARNIQANPLLPGQEVVIVAHSGGGAIAANLAPKLEGKEFQSKDGQVSSVRLRGIVTLGSPIVNRDGVLPITNLIEIQDRGEWIGRQLIRSNEARTFFPVASGLLGPVGAALSTLGFDRLARDENNRVVVSNSGNSGPGNAHTSYWLSDEVYNIIKPKLNLP